MFAPAFELSISWLGRRLPADGSAIDTSVPQVETPPRQRPRPTRHRRSVVVGSTEHTNVHPFRGARKNVRAEVALIPGHTHSIRDPSRGRGAVIQPKLASARKRAIHVRVALSLQGDPDEPTCSGTTPGRSGLPGRRGAGSERCRRRPTGSSGHGPHRSGGGGDPHAAPVALHRGRSPRRSRWRSRPSPGSSPGLATAGSGASGLGSRSAMGVHGQASAHRGQAARPDRGRRRQARLRGPAPPAAPTRAAPTLRASAATASAARTCNVRVDDYSRLAYVEVLPDQKTTTAIGFLRLDQPPGQGNRSARPHIVGPSLRGRDWRAGKRMPQALALATRAMLGTRVTGRRVETRLPVELMRTTACSPG